MTLIVLGVDGLDYGLVDKWDISGYKLSQSKNIETFSYSRDFPKTIEVWPTVATGVDPEEHGIHGKNVSDWNNPVLRKMSNYSHHLPSSVNRKIRSILDSSESFEFGIKETNTETVFDKPGRAVQSWPGVKNSEDLVEVWQMTDKGYSEKEFKREVFSKAAGQIGWVIESMNYDPSLTAAHIHATDILGHVYTNNETEINLDGENIDLLKHSYEYMYEFVDEIKDAMDSDDELLILSDHGMRNQALDDDDFGTHSYRAFASTSLDDPLPDSLFGIKDYIEKNIGEADEYETMDMPKEQLRDLGYIN